MYKTSIKYDAPPNKGYEASPKKINYDIRNRVKKQHNWKTRYPPHIVLGGEWDKLKTKFEDKWIYKSYVQRYRENDPWEETRYYSNYREKGYSHDAAMGELKKYDDIFRDIKTNGYDSDKPVRLYIGRNGEYMRVTGQNRLCMAKVLELDSISVQIDLVHKQWQELRDEIHNNGLPEGREDLHDHPDLQDVLN